MCLAIYKPAGVNIDHKYLNNGFENHSDGAGIAWAQDGVLHVKKGMFKIEEVIEQYELVKQYPCLIHFRKATHGKIDELNCHPFLFNDNKLALIHNGVLPIKCCIDGLSDTAHFVKLVLEPMVKFHRIPIDDGPLNYLINTSIGSDKMAVMDGDGKTYIFNEDKGNWDEGAWYSNTSFKWAYGKTTYVIPGGEYKGCASKTSNTTTNKATNNTETNWRKHWDDDEKNDDAYLDFWKKSLENNEHVGSVTTLAERAKHLLELPNSEKETSVDTVAAPEHSEGQMCEYGWFDSEIESDIEVYQQNLGVTREEALLRIFNEK